MNLDLQYRRPTENTLEKVNNQIIPQDHYNFDDLSPIENTAGVSQPTKHLTVNTTIDPATYQYHQQALFHRHPYHPDFFAEKAPWYERLPCAPSSDHEAPLASLWVCAANPTGRFRHFLRNQIIRTRHRVRRLGDTLGQGCGGTKSSSWNVLHQDIAAANHLPNCSQSNLTRNGAISTVKSHSSSSRRLELLYNVNRFGASWMVSASGFVQTHSVGNSLKPAGADVVDCFMLGGDSAEALVVIYVNNKMAIYNLMDRHYIPTVETVLPIAQNSVPTCASYDPSTMTCLIGTNRGIVLCCQIDEGLNSMSKIAVSEKSFADNISCLKYLPKSELILATNSYFLYVFDVKSLVITQQYPSQSPNKGNYSFIEISPNEDRLFLGTSSGTIEIIDHNKGRCILTNTLPGHKSQITSIYFMSEKSMLFTGDKNGHIQMWHMQAGFQMINLFYHSASILSMHTYVYNDKLYLASLCANSHLVHWDLTRNRNAPVPWHEGAECETCTKPFFWNIKKLWALGKPLGSRRHHCRSCGKSLCINCVAVVDRIPHYGLEVQSNACFECKANYRDEDLQSSIVILKPSDSKLILGHFSSFNDSENDKHQNAIVTLSSSFFQKVNVMILKHL